MPRKKIFSGLWLEVERSLKEDKELIQLEKDDEDAAVNGDDEPVGEEFEEIVRQMRIEFPDSLLETFIKKTNEPEKPKDPVLAIYDKLVDNVWQIDSRQERYEMFKKKNPPNLPILMFMIRNMSGPRAQSISFRTIRNNETVQIDIELLEVQPRFYDVEAGGSDEYCLKIFMHKRLVNPEKFQQEFSAFLASGNHLCKFIIETIWPHIDEAVERDEQKAQQRKLRRENQKKIPRENHSRYSLRARKIYEKSNDVENSRENQRKNRRLKNHREGIG